VPLLISKDSVAELEKLCDKDIRKHTGVSNANEFAFASTKQSELYFSGFHVLIKVCKRTKDLKDPQFVNVTNKRHRVSTLYRVVHRNYY